jgi:hypothetical protein
VHGLAGDAQSVSDLLPRPAFCAGSRDMAGFDSLSQAMERQRGTKPDRRVIRQEIRAELFDIHVCQFKLTARACQIKLTPALAVVSCLLSRIALPG